MANGILQDKSRAVHTFFIFFFSGEVIVPETIASDNSMYPSDRHAPLSEVEEESLSLSA